MPMAAGCLAIREREPSDLPNQKLPSRLGRRFGFASIEGLSLHHRAEFVAIDDHAAVGAVVADLARDHLHRHADAHGLSAEIGQLGGHNRTLIQFDHGNGVGSLLFKASRSIAVAGEGPDLTLTAEGEGCFSFATAFRADIAGWIQSHPVNSLQFHYPKTEFPASNNIDTSGCSKRSGTASRCGAMYLTIFSHLHN